MGLSYKSLNTIIRTKMIEEFQADLDNDKVYLSKRFTDEGGKNYADIMISHLTTGNDDSLSNALNISNCFRTHEERKTAKGVISVKVPDTASQTFSEGEFNRFYIRALCLQASEQGLQLRVYRARHSDKPRTESEALVGTFIDPIQLLVDLRNNMGIDTALGLPPGPNSGLSVELIEA